MKYNLVLLSVSALWLFHGAASFADTAQAPPAAATIAAPISAPLATASTVQFTETSTEMLPTGGRQVMVETVKEARPNQLMMSLSQATGSANATTIAAQFISDGTKQYIYVPASQEYRSMSPEPITPTLLGLQQDDQKAWQPPIHTTLDGKPMLLYKQMAAGQDGQGHLRKYWVDAQTQLPYRCITYTGTGMQAHALAQVDYADWKLNAPLDASVFKWTPPAGAHEHIDPKVVANGTLAPDFTVQDRSGNSVKLSDYRGKVVVLDFWATWCGPCQESLPHTNHVAAAYKGQNVVVLAVNVWDSKDAFEKWLPQHAQYGAINFVIDTSAQGKDVASSLYGVDGIPTQFVISKDGKIVTSFVGYDGPTDDLSNAIKTAAAM